MHENALEMCTSNAPKAKSLKERAELLGQHAFEHYQSVMDFLQAFELSHNITTRWTPASDEWKQAYEYLSTREYQKALAKLEALVVSRLFELQKIGLSGTGAQIIIIQL
jgi:hypothetical protein